MYKLITRRIFDIAILVPFLLTIAILYFQVTVKAYHHIYAGSAVKWQNLPVNFIVDNDNATFQTQIQSAFTTWNNVATARDVLGSRTNSTVNFTGSNFMMAWGNLTSDGQHEIVFDDDGSALQAAGLNPSRTNGVAVPKIRNGVIEDVYFILNGSRTNFDALSTIIHELGHAQGLNHSSVGMHNSGSFPSEALNPININSVPTMHPYSVAGIARQTLEPDDVASISELYPEASFETSFSTIEGKITRCFVSGTSSVSGANIRIVNTSNNTIQLSRFTGFDGNTQGKYLIKGVPPGTYRVIVEPMGANDFTIDKFPTTPTTFETDFATEYLSVSMDENTCPEEIPDMPTDLMATAGTTLSDKDIKVQNIKLALVVDDTGSMTEEIAGVRTGLSNAITRLQQISQQTGEPFPDVAIITFKDDVTNRLVSNNPTRLQTVISGLTASGGGDCPESSNSALQTAGRFLRNRGVAVLATDANSRPDGPDRATVETQYRAKSLKISTLLSGICPNTLTPKSDENLIEKEQNCSIFQTSSNLEEYAPPATLGVESSVRTYSELATETGGLFVFLPGVNSSSTVEKERYANIAANLFVSSAVPAIGLISPGDGIRGRTMTVEIDGLTTNFQGSSQVSFGDGVTVNSRIVNSPEKITVNITVASDAVLGFRNVTVTTSLGSGATEIATGVGAFNIINPAAGPKLISITPTQGSQGSTLNIDVFGSNTNFVNGTSVANFGDGITINSTTVINPTQAVVNITIQNKATIGLRDVIVTTGSEEAGEDLPGPFLITAPSAIIPRISAINPIQGERGRTLNITVTGENTNFVSGVSAVSFSGTGITVNSTTVNSPTSATANITIAPDAALTFRDVIVTTNGEVAAGLNVFQVTPVLNNPPICLNARPSTAVITPPNRSFVPINILGVTDPENDPVTLNITTITQDEPVDHIGDGSFVPDSVINGSTVLVRAESILGTVVVNGTTFVGNGRFYHINFTATDTSNTSCTGTVKVAVPHTRTATPIDGGPLFNSITAQPARFSDFDGDRKTDFSVFREGNWYINNSFNGQIQFINFGLPSDKIIPADYDGDGKTDIAVFRDGIWYLHNSSGGTRIQHFGLTGDIPVPGDYDGDGKDDLAVFRQGMWYLLQSTKGVAAIPFGLSFDKPVPGDYDGDGRTDIAVFRGGIWYLLRSSQGFSAIQFGLPADKLIPSDYDGDGKTDIGIFRNGIWYLLKSSQGISIFQFGLSADIPTPADYDGDGKSDISVFREGYWYTFNSSNGQFNIVKFGVTDDKPIPSAFVP